MNLLKAASTVSILTLLSRVTGLVREQLGATLFGASALMDAFQVSFRIPNMLRRLFAEGAFSQAFVPVLSATRAEHGDAATRDLIDAVASVLAWALLGVSALGIAAAPVVVWLMGSGLREFDAAVLMTRWMFPYIAFMSLVALAAAVLNTWRRFAVPAVTPVLLNLAVIAAAWWGAPTLQSRGVPGIYALAIGVMAGGFLQLAIQIPALRAIGCLPRLALAPAAVAQAWRHPGVRRVLRQMAPALLGVSVAQLSLLINTRIASNQGVGAVSWLTFADRLMEFPTALLGVALGVVLLPQLSAAARSQGDPALFSGLLDWGLRLVLLLALPCAVALVVFAQPLLAVLFHYGAFTAMDVQQSAVALRGYGVGLIGIVAIKVLAPGYYARQDVRTPVRIAIVVLVATQLMNLALVPSLGHAGLALSIGLGALVNALWLLVGLLRSGSYRPTPGWSGFALRVVLASMVMGVGLWWANKSIDWIGLQSHALQRAGWMAVALSAVAVAYFGALTLLGLKLRQFSRRA